MIYSANDKMSALLGNDPHALRIVSRFPISLGVGDKTIGEVCNEHDVHTDTFLAIVNYGNSQSQINKISIQALMDYLRLSHEHFFNFALPRLRRELIEAIDYTVSETKVPILIIKYFDEYVNEISIHMHHENEQVFPYIESLLKGEKTKKFSIEQFASQHRAVDDQNIAHKLSELKDLIIKYYPKESDNSLLLEALYDLFVTEKDIATHCDIEDNLLLPAIRLLEKETKLQNKSQAQKTITEELSDREKDVLIEVVNGLSNKEIADKLFISIHTVISHRKNISRKLNIHSTAGLTIYAIVNNLVDINHLS